MQAFGAGRSTKFTWVDVGSSYLPGEVIAGFPRTLLKEADAITARERELGP